MSASLFDFIPPFCPRTRCRYHHCAEGWKWNHHGSYVRDCPPYVIPRFRCGHCGSTFSTQTFSPTYYLKRPDLQERLFHRLVACSCYRQIARELLCSHSTLMRQAARLGRHSLLVMAEALEQLALAAVSEPLVIDGFESFAYSQYHPLHLHLVIGSKSHFTYGFTHSRLRRKGTMTAPQRRRRERIEERHGRPDPKAIEIDMAAAIRMAVPAPQPLLVHSDEHPAYPRSFRRLAGLDITHHTTHSSVPRTLWNKMHPCNRMDNLLRHSGSNHKRETIAFSKRHQCVIERAAVHLVWCNFSKGFSENHDPGTPAMRAGLAKTPMSPAALLERRRFPSRMKLPGPWAAYYTREVDTPGIDTPVRHRLMRAY